MWSLQLPPASFPPVLTDDPALAWRWHSPLDPSIAVIKEGQGFFGDHPVIRIQNWKSPIPLRQCVWLGGKAGVLRKAYPALSSSSSFSSFMQFLKFSFLYVSFPFCLIPSYIKKQHLLSHHTHLILCLQVKPIQYMEKITRFSTQMRAQICAKN